MAGQLQNSELDPCRKTVAAEHANYGWIMRIFIHNQRLPRRPGVKPIKIIENAHHTSSSARYPPHSSDLIERGRLMLRADRRATATFNGRSLSLSPKTVFNYRSHTSCSRTRTRSAGRICLKTFDRYLHNQNTVLRAEPSSCAMRSQLYGRSIGG